ncbi:MAG: hemolysin III family protein [Rhodospirillales bacterium]|nr:hemolysin III family protein [Rhodospirillales bacterium]
MAYRTWGVRTSLPRPLSRNERIADCCVNGVAISAGLVGVVVLMVVAIPQANDRLTMSLLVYAAGLLAMLTTSALYNALPSSRHKDLLRRLDHAAIFLMIAGTYTPFLQMKLDAGWARWLLVYVWAVAGVGVTLKLIWINRFERLSVLLYLFLGWTILVVIGPLSTAMATPAVVLLAIGGVLYSAGVLFHLWEQLAYQQAIWHGFVAAAAACHYAAVLGGVVLSGGFS